MKNIPFAPKFDINDLKAIAIFEKIADDIPDKRGKAELVACINHIKMHFNAQASEIYLQIFNNTNKEDYSFYNKSLKEQIEICEDVTSKSFKIELKYYNKDNDFTEVLCTPKEVIYDNKNAYLRIYKNNSNLIEDIPVNNIMSVIQLPTQKDNLTASKTVAFRLKGRLAKAYTLKDGEYISEYGDDGSVLVINRNEPEDALLSRLMRYDYDCVIEYPKELKRKMHEKINDTLKNYE